MGFGIHQSIATSRCRTTHARGRAENPQDQTTEERYRRQLASQARWPCRTLARPLHLSVRCAAGDHTNAIFCSSWWRPMPSQAGTQYGRILRLHHCRVSAYRALPLHRRAYAPQVQPRACCDEYQDTSTTQAALLAALFHVDASQRSAVNAVGHLFQSIYAWRGASPGAFRMFQQDFHLSAGYKPFPLSVTRRNSRIVLEAANNLTLPLRSNPSRPSSSLMREVDVSSLDPMPDARRNIGSTGLRHGRARDGRRSAPLFFLQDGHRTAPFRSRTTGTDAGRTESAGRRAVSVQITYARISGGIGTGRIDHIRGRLFRAVGTSGNPPDLMALLHVAADHTDTGLAHALAGHATIHHVRSGFDHVGPFC